MTRIPRRRTLAAPARKTKAPHTRRDALIEHVTQADGNVFADIGFPPEEAENLLIRSTLMLDIERRISKMTQVNAAKLLGVSQPRVSDLLRGKMEMFTIDALVNMLARAGADVRVSVRFRRQS